jgi:3-oxoacyl-[acyl-carrier protein] reductase
MNVIISGASKGIGSEVAKLAASQGHNVLAIARNKENLEQLSNTNKHIVSFVADLVSVDLTVQLKEWVESVGKIDLLVNNAGQLINKPFMETSKEEFRTQFDVNVLSAINLCQAAVPWMSGTSHIVNITSMGGFQGSSKYSGLSAYSSSKGALSVLTECLAEEFRGKGISANALALGAVQTEMLEEAFPGFQAPVSAAEMAAYILNFGLTGHRYYNGIILPVTIGNP